MSWTKIENHAHCEQLNTLLADVDWENFFVREVSVVSPSYMEDGNYCVAPGCLPCIRVFISGFMESLLGLEIMLVEAESLFLSFVDYLNPRVEFLKLRSSVKWTFNDATPAIICRPFYYRVLEKSTWGRNLRYGWEDVFDHTGTLNVT